MFKTQDFLTYTLILSITIFLFVFYKDKLIKNKYVQDVFKMLYKVSEKDIVNQAKESTDNLFVTEYEVSDTVDGAISDALKNVE